MIRLTDVQKEYENGTHALRGVTMEVNDGEFVFLVGPSGSGKSTIIKLLTGEVLPSGGRLMINGFNLNNISDRQIPLLRRSIGVIFQDFRLIEKKTVYENLSFAMRAVGSSPREAKKRIPYVLKLVGLDGKANQFPNQLSGGEQQRVAIAIALANSPKILLADEPTGAVDVRTANYILDVFREINRTQGVTIVIVTHDRLLSKKVNRVVAIRDGKISSERIVKQSYLDRLSSIATLAEEEQTQDEFAILDRAGRLQIPRELLEQLHVQDNKLRLTLQDGKIILEKPETEENK